MRLVASVAAVSVLATAAAAQNPQPGQAPAAKNPQASQPPAANENTAQMQQSIRQQVQKHLEQAGFTNIELIPSSFLVRAKDKNGKPVMMVINPNLVSAMTKVPGSQGQTTGQGGR